MLITHSQIERNRLQRIARERAQRIREARLNLNVRKGRAQ